MKKQTSITSFKKFVFVKYINIHSLFDILLIQINLDDLDLDQIYLRLHEGSKSLENPGVWHQASRFESK